MKKIFLSLLIILMVRTAYAGSEDLMVSGVWRLTHSAYRVGNIYYGVHTRLNRNETRILISESGAFTDPSTGEKGRGLVWGTLADLKTWTTLAEYKAATSLVQPICSTWSPISTYWSPLVGEENVIYTLCKTTKKLIKKNVDTGVITDIVSYDPGDGTDVTYAEGKGFTTDNTYIVNFNQDENFSGGYEINVQTGARTRYTKIPSTCSDWNSTQDTSEVLRRGEASTSHGHGGLSPDGKYYVYGAGSYNYVYRIDNGQCVQLTNFPQTDGNYFFVNHMNWIWTNNNWFIASTGNLAIPSCPTQPTLTNMYIKQVYFDRVSETFDVDDDVILLTHKSANRWATNGVCNASNPNYVENYQAHMIAASNYFNGSTKVLFTSTDGKYSYDDHVKSGVTFWGTEGLWLLELTSKSGPLPSPLPPADTTPPAPPKVIKIQ